MTRIPVFPTALHQHAADCLSEFFSGIPETDTVLVVNSCARGQAVPESDLDFAILAKPGTSPGQIESVQEAWLKYSAIQQPIIEFTRSNQFAHLHVDIITGQYTPTILEVGVASDFFEIEIGNQICYSVPMGATGNYFREFQNKWLPYYDEDLRQQRLGMTIKACEYDLNHIPRLVKRGLYFHAFDILYKAFQEYLQVLFIANKTYPIAYNKWIKEQVVNWLQRPDVYTQLLDILVVSKIESNDTVQKAEVLRGMLNKLWT